jgi:hypothetical protein
MYRPSELQWEYHQDPASEILVVGGNRSGKSLCTFIEDAWAVTGTHPVPGKYPKENGVLVIIGAGWKHIGLTVVPMLFKAGAFKMIRDKATGHWRAFDPVADAGREKETKPAPPLIPPRLIKSMSWLLKSANYLNVCELVNGWTIHFFSSEAKPQQGFKANRVHIDEDIENEDWVLEMQARLPDLAGNFAWSAMPHSKNDALMSLNERAEKALETGNKDIKRYILRFMDNPHISEDEKRKMLERWSAAGENVLRQRSEGEFNIDSIKVYPNFNMSIHGYDQSSLPGGQVPAEWCRYASIDPGHSVTAVTFAAVPPEGTMILLYDELYIRNCDAVIFAQEMLKKTQGTQFFAFLIDSHGGRLTDIGSGRSPQDQYTEQLANLGIRSQATGSSFIPGVDNIQAGLHSVRTALHIRPDGTPRLRVLRGAMPNLENEMKRYKKKVEHVGTQTVVKDEPNKRGDFHLVDCLRYLCAYEPRYHVPVVQKDEWWGYAWKKQRDEAKNVNGSVYLTPNSYTKSWVA